VTAAYLHLTAAEPSMIHPHQSLFRFTADVVIEQGHYAPRGGIIAVPDEPGLGVTLDHTALRRNERSLPHRRRDGDLGWPLRQLLPPAVNRSITALGLAIVP